MIRQEVRGRKKFPHREVRMAKFVGDHVVDKRYPSYLREENDDLKNEKLCVCVLLWFFSGWYMPQ